jgi:hypothetical protein
MASAEKRTRESLTDIESNLANTVKRIACDGGGHPACGLACPEPSFSVDAADAELPPFTEAPLWVTPRDAEAASQTKQASQTQTSNQPVISSSMENYLAQARRAGRASAESEEDSFRRSRRQKRHR